MDDVQGLCDAGGEGENLGERQASRLSMSAYARALALGERPVGALDLDAVARILKATGDLDRLGGLLKMLLTNDERLEDIGRDMGRVTIDGTLVDIRRTQADLADLVNAFVRKTKARL